MSSGNPARPIATARWTGISPRVTAPKMVGCRPRSATASCTSPSVSGIPSARRSSTVVFVSRMNFAASMAVPRPSAMFASAPLARAFSALSALMNRESKTRNWESVTRAEVARELAEEHGYEGQFIDVDDTEETLDVISQTAETDARFLRRLAAREEFEFYVDDGGFHFHERRQDAAPTHVFTWYADPGRGDLLSVNVESDLVRRAGRVTVRGRDPL